MLIMYYVVWNAEYLGNTYMVCYVYIYIYIYIYIHALSVSLILYIDYIYNY